MSMSNLPNRPAAPDGTHSADLSCGFNTDDCLSASMDYESGAGEGNLRHYPAPHRVWRSGLRCL